MATHKIRVSEGGSKKKPMVIFEITGDFTIEQTENIRRIFVENIDKFTDFEVRVNQIESFDLSALQLLIALKKRVEKDKKKLNISIDLPAHLKQLTVQSGLMEYLN